MAVRKRIRQAGRKLLAHVRGHGQAVRARLPRRRKDQKHTRDSQVYRLDQQVAAIAAEVLAGRYIETPLELIRIIHLDGCTEEDALRALEAVCPQHGVTFLVQEHRVGPTTTKVVVFRSLAA